MGIERSRRELLGDIEGLWRANAELAEAQRAAEAANVAKSDFLATMSHEIRTPMTGVLCMLGLLLDTELSPQQVELVGLARSSANSLLGIINDLLDFTRMEAGGMRIEETPFRLRGVIDELAAQQAVIARMKGLSLEVRYPPDLPELLIGDPGRVRQVITNLVGNAVKFTQQGMVVIDVTCADGEVRIAVHDTGLGIAPEHVDRIFERYAQAEVSTARRFGGSGLGLSISRQLVELMGGSISVRSKVGEGTTFSVTLPLRRTAEHEPAAAIPPPPPTLDGKRVLVADDSAINQLVASSLLSKVGCTVEIAENGLEVLRKLEEQPYDMVLMDCEMPHLDGFQTTAAIRRSEAPYRTVPIVAVTGHALAGDRDRCLAAGMDGYVSKPLQAEDLRGVVERYAAALPCV